eukprot:scaffold56860_cov51-Phaeocystis_antarctica.AAC.1
MVSSSVLTLSSSRSRLDERNKAGMAYRPARTRLEATPSLVWHWRGASKLDLALAGELAEASGRRFFHMGSRRKLSISACSSATGCRASVATRLARVRVK